MNVAAQFLFWEYFFRIFVIGSLQWGLVNLFLLGLCRLLPNLIFFAGLESNITSSVHEQRFELAILDSWYFGHFCLALKVMCFLSFPFLSIIILSLHRGLVSCVIVSECYNINEQVIAYSIEATSVVLMVRSSLVGCGISLLSNSDEVKRRAL
jgi:hypothetical protein